MDDIDRGAEVGRNSVLVGLIPSGDIDADGFPLWVEHIFAVRSAGGDVVSPYTLRVRIETQAADGDGHPPLATLEARGRSALASMFSIGMSEADLLGPGLA